MAIAKVRAAIEELKTVDPIIRAHIEAHEPCPLKPKSGGRDHFEQLARNIAYQQLAGKAAATIWGRVRALVDGPFTAEAVRLLSEEELRGAGLSGNKMLSLRDLADHVLTGQLPLDRLARQSDDQVIEELVRVRGIGRWTAEMFLMSQLGRLDVWPIGDLGVRNGYRLLYKLPELPTVQELDAYGDKYRPYRSVAAWYMWRAADTLTP